MTQPKDLVEAPVAGYHRQVVLQTQRRDPGVAVGHRRSSAFERHESPRILFSEVFGSSGEIGRAHFSQAEIDAVRDPHGLPQALLAGPAGAVKTIRFRLNGQEIIALNGGNSLGRFHESFSLYGRCRTQEQIDRLWVELSVRGQQQPCGWVKDRFGVSWQIAPDPVLAVEEGADAIAAERMNPAIPGMPKIDLGRILAGAQPLQ